MIVLALLLLFSASTSVNLVDEVYQIPAHEWRYSDAVTFRQRPALIYASYEVESGSSAVKLVLMRHEDLERFRDGLPYGWIMETSAERRAHIAHVCDPGDYVLVVDNRDGDTAAAVRLRISLDFTTRLPPEAVTLSAGRKLVVVLISFAVFFGIVTFSAQRLARAIKR